MLSSGRFLSDRRLRAGAAAAAALLVVALSGARKPSAPPAPGNRPSVVLVTLDTTRADRLGCYGRAGAGTPNLDRLAAGGVRFDDAWAAAPITLPSHLSMMTGCTPVTHGVRDNGVTKYDGRIPTLAARFAANGYRTAAVVSASVLDSVWGANAGFGVYDERFDRKGERSGAAATTRALEILGSSTEPFFLWVHYYDAHWKYEPPAPFAARYPDDPYQGEIASVDFEVGRLLAGLEKAGRKPIVVVAGDHGEGLGEHAERTHGIFTYRSTLRVPFLIAGPGIAPGRIVREPVSLVDLAPTVAELAGLPAARLEDGVSLGAVVLRRAAAPALRRIYFESMLPFNSYGWVFPRGATDGRHVFIDLPRREVYDLRSDPGQTKNLYAAGDSLSQGLARNFETLAADLARRAGQGNPVRLSDEERARLASLGYLSGLSSKTAAPTLDPKDVIDFADRIDQAKELHENGRFDEAIAIADAVIRRNPDNVPALAIRGQALLSQKRYREAASAFGEAVARNPSIAVNRFDLGSSLAGAGETAKAEAEWRKAIELEPHFAEPRASLIAAYRGRGETAKALALSREAAASGAESAELDFEIALTYATSGDLDAAERWFETAVRLRPAYVEALGNLGRIAYEKGRIDESLARFRAASAAAPGDSQFLKQIGAILLNDRKDPRGALAAFRAALALERDPQERAQITTMISELEREVETSR
jgi:arylsulfatase A-like enzyme/Tfp pilus assembly protein PilF